jgi:signal transduction histidine kinase
MPGTEVPAANNADGSKTAARLTELRGFSRALADDDSVQTTLRAIAESVRVATDSVAVHIEQYSGEAANVVMVSAGPQVRTTVAVDAESENLRRIMISLGRRQDRLGAIVLFRSPDAPEVAPMALERVADLAMMAALALRRNALKTAVERTRLECQRIVDDKYRLINGIADELKNRLGAAAEYVQLLDTEGELNPRETSYIDGSRRSIDAAVRMINELVQLSRADTGRLEMQMEPVNFGAVLRGIVRDYQLGVGTIDLHFDVFVPRDLPVIQTDVDLVRQVLDTLLSNAVRYTPIGGRITVNADIRPGRRKSDPSKYICLSVTDTGPGVGDQDLIFEEVYRVERRGAAPGFRLAISRRIARLLGGELSLETETDQGSTFTLWLPDTPSKSTLTYTALKEPQEMAAPRLEKRR